MTWLKRPGLAALLCLAGGCGGLPTAPSPIAAPTGPVPVAFTVLPEPLSVTLTGTWYVGDQDVMTLTQDGLWVTGMERDSSTTTGAVTTTTHATLSGTVCGNAVTLERSISYTIAAADRHVQCTASGTFVGTLSGNTLSGRYTAGAAPIECSSAPPIALNTIEGPATFTRQ
jgi:hypothetical protein